MLGKQRLRGTASLVFILLINQEIMVTVDVGLQASLLFFLFG